MKFVLHISFFLFIWFSGCENKSIKTSIKYENIVVNYANANPRTKGCVDIYNGAMGLIGVYHVGKGVVNFAKSLPDATKNLLRENKSLQAIIKSKYLDWQAEITKLGDLTPEELKLKQQQEQVWRMLGVAEDMEKLPSVIRQLLSKPAYKPLRTIWSKPNKTTTIIGKWQGELEILCKELSETTDLNIYMLSGKFDHPGGFNMLSIEDWSNLADDLSKKGIAQGTKAFDDYIWETYNKPWIESAMQRGDDIILWSDPINFEIKRFIDGNGKTFYEREIDFIRENSLKYEYNFKESINIGVLKK